MGAACPPLTAAVETLSLEDCTSEALLRNPGLAAAQKGVEAARANYKGAYSGFFPQLSLNGTYGPSNAFGTPGVVGFTGQYREQYILGITATQELFSGFKDRSNIDLGKANVAIAVTSVQLEKAQLSFDLKNNFALLLYAQDQIRLTEEIAKRRAANVKLVELRYLGGRENKGSYLKSKADLRQSQFEVTQAVRSLQVSQSGLSRVLGRSSVGELKVVGLWKIDAPTKPEDLQKTALATPTYLQAQANTQAATANKGIARSEFFPEIDLVGTWGRQGLDVFPPDDRWALMVQITFPFFPGGKNIFDYESASANQIQNELTQADTANQTLAKLESTFATYLNAFDNIGVQQENLSAAAVRAEISRSKYSNGLLTFEDWVIIEDDLIAKEKSALQSQRDAFIAQASWEQAQGKGVFP
jgi:outer membrane protein